MATVLNKETKQLILSANTPDYDPSEWLINPDLSSVDSVPKKYWKIVGDQVVEMSPAEKSEVDIILAPQPLDQALSVYREAKNFGIKLQEEFIANNLLLGITQRGLTKHVRKTLQEVNDCITTGSLYDAIDEISRVRPEDFDDAIITAQRLLVFRNKIEEYLGLPLSQQWND